MQPSRSPSPFPPLRPHTLPGAARPFLRQLEALRSGELEVLAPGGLHFRFQGEAPGAQATMELSTWAACHAVLGEGGLGLARAYLSGQCQTPDLGPLLTLVRANPAAWAATQAPGAALGQWLRRLVGGRVPGSVHRRYRLNDAFYASWLDDTMTYSGALFEGDHTRTLEQAQQAKYARILHRLAPAPGAHLLDLGCGWGGFALQAATTHGCPD